MAPVATQRSDLVRLAAAPIALAFGLGALAAAQGPGRFTTYAGQSGIAASFTVAAGFALILAGLITSFVRRAQRIGDLALLAGFVWFAPVWVGWEGGPSIVRSLGMLTAGLTFPLLVHLALAYPSGRLRSAVSRALLWAVYVEATLAGLGRALFRDPFFDPNCWANCTDNSFLLVSIPSFVRAIDAIHRWFAVAAAVALVTVFMWRLLMESGAARRALLPIATPATLFAGAVTAHAIALHRIPREDPSDPAFMSIFIIGGAAIILVAAGLAWAALRTRIQARAVARVVTSLDQAPPPGSLESALSQAVGDTDLRIAYWLPDSRCYVDANGRAVAEPVGGPDRAITTLVRDGRRVAVISHRVALLELDREIGPAVRLALENERLRAELLAQLEELRASRSRIVETGDTERRRLERDLHDGAQQRLLALSYDIRVARASAEAEDEEGTGSLLAKATGEAEAALHDLRELAHGIYPAILEEGGLSPALATLADAAPLPVEIRGGEGRYPSPVEMAAYLLVAEALHDAAGRDATFAAVNAVLDEGRLVVTVEDDGSERDTELVRLADRVGALGGSLEVESTKIRAEIPCG